MSQGRQPGQTRAVRTALVTGGVRRIGRSISLALARAGYAIVLHGRKESPESLGLQAEISQIGVGCGFVAANLGQTGALNSLVARAQELAGPLSLLVNNASQYEDDAFGALDPLRWERQIAVNLTAPIFLAQAFAAQAPKCGDVSIVNITDQRVRKPVPRHFSYSLSKSALDAATIMMAQALAPRVRVNAVAPGPTLASPRQDETAFAAQQAALPLAAGPSPEDIAAAVVFLASARQITGETIAVDGGQHIAWQTPDAFGIDE